jgi:alpha-1,3-rhamnosyl/mannosyltransferase
VVHHGVRAHWFDAPPPKNATPRCAAWPAPGYFLFVGTLQPRKNVERLLEAYLALPPVLRSARQLVIVGAPGWRSEELVKRIKDAQQRGENVVWLDQLTDNAHLRHLYAGAGAFIFPSLHEGFGLPLLEAFASGVPVACSAPPRCRKWRTARRSNSIRCRWAISPPP